MFATANFMSLYSLFQGILGLLELQALSAWRIGTAQALLASLRNVLPTPTLHLDLQA